MTTSTALTNPPSEAESILLPVNANKDTKSRVRMFSTWLTTTGRKWYAPDLVAYRDHLRQTKNAASTSAHLSSIRAAYQRVMRDNGIRDDLYTSPEMNSAASPRRIPPPTAKPSSTSGINGWKMQSILKPRL